jgi:hypothetical protein
MNHSIRKTAGVVIGGLLLLSGVGTAAHAQITGVTVTTADPAAARRMVLARQLLELQGFTQELQASLDQLGPLLAEMLKNDPNIGALPQADQNKINELMILELQNALPVMVDKYAAYFASNLSEPELQELVGIYQKPVVRKLSALSVKAQRDLSEDMGRVGQDAAVRAIQGYIVWKRAQH